MCGISGILSDCLNKENIGLSLNQMTASLGHRGPNSQGVFISEGCGLGHTRLSIIDTSEAGLQPMHREGVILIYNGELYNFQEERGALEKKGYKFFGQSDAEVLLALYLNYGEDCLYHLSGMYAFALWDSRKKTLFCARDPLGIKPFLYANTSQGFVFASELKTILASGLVNRAVDRDSLRILLERGSITQPKTILEGVNWLLPGYFLKVKVGRRPTVKCFRPLKTDVLDLKGFDSVTLKEYGETLLRDIVHRQMVADVPLGAFLSGGMDSSLLVALMAQEHKNLRTFSVGFETGLETNAEDETDDAARVAQHLGVEHTRILIQRHEIADNLRTIARDLDHPTVDGVNAWFVSKAVSKHVTVAISGTGGDELFAGYPWFSAMQAFSRQNWFEKARAYSQGQTFLKIFNEQYRIFDVLMASLLCPHAHEPKKRQEPLRYTGTLNRVTGLLLSGYTRDQLLADIDTAAMAHSLEVRVPLLDEKLLDFALSLPETAKISAGDPSAPPGSYLASGVKRLLLEIGQPLLPKNFADREKRGFILPFDSWLKGPLLPMMNDLLSVDTTTRRGFFDPVEVQAVLNAFLSGYVHWTQPWLLMMTELWAQEVLDGQ